MKSKLFFIYNTLIISVVIIFTVKFILLTYQAKEIESNSNHEVSNENTKISNLLYVISSVLVAALFNHSNFMNLGIV